MRKGSGRRGEEWGGGVAVREDGKLGEREKGTSLFKVVF